MQLTLASPKANPRGGARLGAGRKPSATELRHTPHRSRGTHRAAHPVHVTMRAGSRTLRHQFIAKTVLGSFRAANRAGFRIAEYSIQANHIHLIVEAESAASLSSGMRGLAVRIARRVNPLLFRRGPLWVDRWHGVELTSPRQVRNALVYVLRNRVKHCGARSDANDPLTSAASFDGFASAATARAGPRPSAHSIAAQTWLLCVGWKRHGLIRPNEVPAH